jgi:hypothetical protein
MIQIETGSPEGVVVATAIGRVSASDYTENLIPALDKARADADKLRLLLVLGPDFEGYEGEAALEDAKLGIHNWTSFDRIGLVTDHEAYATLAKAMGFLMPGEVRAFPVADLAAARAWVGSGPTDV